MEGCGWGGSVVNVHVLSTAAHTFNPFTASWSKMSLKAWLIQPQMIPSIQGTSKEHPRNMDVVWLRGKEPYEPRTSVGPHEVLCFLHLGGILGLKGLLLWHIPFTSRVKWLNFGIVFRWLMWSAWPTWCIVPEVQLSVPFTNLISYYPRAVFVKTFPAVVTGSGWDMFTHGHAITWTHKNRFLLYVKGGCLTVNMATPFLFVLFASQI